MKLEIEFPRSFKRDYHKGILKLQEDFLKKVVRPIEGFFEFMTYPHGDGEEHRCLSFDRCYFISEGIVFSARLISPIPKFVTVLYINFYYNGTAKMSRYFDYSKNLDLTEKTGTWDKILTDFFVIMKDYMVKLETTNEKIEKLGQLIDVLNK